MDEHTESPLIKVDYAKIELSILFKLAEDPSYRSQLQAYWEHIRQIYYPKIDKSYFEIEKEPKDE